MYKVSPVSGKEFNIDFSDKELTSGTIDNKSFTLDLIEERPGKFHILKNNRSFNVEVLETDETGKIITISVNGKKIVIGVKDRYDILLHSLGMDTLLSSRINDLKAPMPGLVLDIRVEPGAMVKKGDSIVVLEAMKMENILKSPSDGIIKSIMVKKGMAVEKNQVLVNFD